MIKFIKGVWYYRVKLPVWFLLLAIWTVISPKIGRKVLEAYVKAEKARINAKADKLHT